VRLYVCKAGILYSIAVLVHSELLRAHPGGVTLVVQQYIRPSEVFVFVGARLFLVSTMLWNLEVAITV
jgi:hypothetical protein